jgi:adenosylmethionine-8-amino-7-oxononanoate aminotransferase
LANIALLESEGLLDRALKLEVALHQRLESLADHPLVASVRGGTGVLGALELDPERDAVPGLPLRVFEAVREHGALIRPMVSAVGFSPPLTTADEQLDELADAVRAGLDDVHRG